MGLKNEIRYALGKISSLGSYPFHLLMTVLVFKLEMYQATIILLCGFILIYAIGIPMRLFMFHDRKHLKMQDQFLSRYNASSFPSFHSARATFLALFLANYFNYEWDIILLSVIIIVLVSYARIINNQHYLSDAIGGTLLGGMLWLALILII